MSLSIEGPGASMDLGKKWILWIKIKAEMFETVICEELNFSQTDLLLKGIVPVTVTAVLLDQLENVVAARESMLTESLGFTNGPNNNSSERLEAAIVLPGHLVHRL